MEDAAPMSPAAPATAAESPPSCPSSPELTPEELEKLVDGWMELYGTSSTVTPPFPPMPAVLSCVLHCAAVPHKTLMSVITTI